MKPKSERIIQPVQGVDLLPHAFRTDDEAREWYRRMQEIENHKPSVTRLQTRKTQGNAS